MRNETFYSFHTVYYAGQGEETPSPRFSENSQRCAQQSHCCGRCPRQYQLRAHRPAHTDSVCRSVERQSRPRLNAHQLLTQGSQCRRWCAQLVRHLALIARGIAQPDLFVLPFVDALRCPELPFCRAAVRRAWRHRDELRKPWTIGCVERVPMREEAVPL